MAISTTGEPHRMGFLETCVKQWDKVLNTGDPLFVTVDGDEAACERVRARLDRWTGSVFRVGQPLWSVSPFNGRMGVAVSKNTGLELMMDKSPWKPVEHLFLCDDDTWPLHQWALAKHVNFAYPHSMVCWGEQRLLGKEHGYASWSWPRGAVLYAHRSVVETVGGMDERFGAPGGHEHVEWSRRIHQHGLTPVPYLSPLVYAETGEAGPVTRAGSFWHAEDMRKVGEPYGNHRYRRRKISSIDKRRVNWAHREKIMVERDGDTSYVPFRAHENGRSSATLCSTSTGRGAGGAQ